MVTCPGQLNLGIHVFGANLVCGDLAGQMKNKTNISLLTCTRHSAAPTTNVAVLEVSKPTPN